MAPFSCCSFGRVESPELQPAVLTDTSQTGGRFALSSHTPSRAGSRENVSNIQRDDKVFSASIPQDTVQANSTASGNDIALAHETEPGVRHRGSNRRLHGVASKVRKRMSRDSGMSKRSSKTRLRSSTSEDENHRREELKRALHQRVQEDIDEGSNISDGSFDEDAVPIKTPSGTLGRHKGSIHISPKHLSNALRRSESPSAYTELGPRIISQAYAPKNTAVALSRMLIQRGSGLARESEEAAAESEIEISRGASVTQKYKFSDEDITMQVAKTRSHSSLGRSNTVLHVPSSVKTLEMDVANPEFLNTPGVSPRPDILSIRVKKTRDSAPGNDSRIWFSDVRQAASSDGAHTTQRNTLGSARLPGVYDTKIRPASEQLLHGTLGLWGHSVDSKRSNIHSATDTHTSSSEGHSCNPGREEMSFGGTDGKDHSLSTSETEAGSLTRQRVRSEGSDPVHLYNMHIPQRLASKPLLPSVSLPQLQHPRRDRSYTSGSSRKFSVIPRSQASSSMSTSGKLFKTPATHLTSSSVYSSGSLASSPPESTIHVNSLSDRLYYLEMFQPSEEIISVPATRPKSVDLDILERRTVETSYHSSNESLMNRELAAAQTRISPLPRANTLPKNSRFREDLDRISAELALTNPPRRRVSNLDGTRSPSNENATSVWEKALREHSKEDKAISHMRVGSTFPDGVGPRQLDPMTASSAGDKARRRSSFLRMNDGRTPHPLEGADLQAHLGAYTLSQRRESPSKRPTIEDTRGSPPASRASSWARYPSHTRPERSVSPAGVSDQVYSRDFANFSPGTVSKVSKNESSPVSNSEKVMTKSRTFGKQLLSTVSSIYKSQSQDLQRRIADEARGHRSSISEGGVLEYPELEMLGSISPPMPSPDIDTKLELEDRVRKASEPQGALLTRSSTHSSQVSRKQSQDWAREYQHCIRPQPTHSLAVPPARDHALDRVKKTAGYGVDGEGGVRGRRRASDGVGHGGGFGLVDADVRASTLDFKRSLELDEWKARERVRELGLGMGVERGVERGSGSGGGM
ncbi:hypothetical protein BDR22DRAFT_826394 [Usnea florida]